MAARFRDGVSAERPLTDLVAARAARRRGRLAEARARYAAAYAIAETSGQADELAEAALGYCGLWVNEHRLADSFANSQRMVRTAQERVDERSVLHALLAVRLAADACYAGKGSHEAVAQSVEDVRRHGNRRALAEALSLQVHTLLAPSHRGLRAGVVNELMDAAVAAGDEFLVLLALCWRCVDAFLAGDPEAMRLLKTLETRSESADVAIFGYICRVLAVMLMLRDGRFAEVEASLEKLTGEGLTIGEVDAENWAAGQFFVLRYLQGRTDELVSQAQGLAESPALTHYNRAFAAVAAVLFARAGMADRARIALARVAPFEAAPHGLTESSVWLITMAAVVETAYALNDTDLARAAYEVLAPHADLPILGSLAVVCLGSTHRALAMCAITFGDHQLARQHCEHALAVNLRLGHLPMIAISRAELARELMRAGEKGRAASLYNEALTSARALDMPGFVQQWTREVEQLATAPAGRCVRAGRSWEIESPAGRAMVGDSVGMRALAVLLTNPRRDIAVSEITGAIESRSAQPVLDAPAWRAFRAKFDELRDDIAQADIDADLERAARLRYELDALAKSMSGSLDHRGRSRSFPDAVERARTSTQKALRRALGQIAEQAPELAAGLERSIRTGATCRFDPVPGVPVRWLEH